MYQSIPSEVIEVVDEVQNELRLIEPLHRGKWLKDWTYAQDWGMSYNYDGEKYLLTYNWVKCNPLETEKYIEMFFTSETEPQEEVNVKFSEISEHILAQISEPMNIQPSFIDAYAEVFGIKLSYAPFSNSDSYPVDENQCIREYMSGLGII